MSRPPPPANGSRNMSNGSTPSMTSTLHHSNRHAGTPSAAAAAAAAAPSGRTPSASNANPLVGPASNSNSTNSMSRAERFEDEKRRIIDSCFSKLDGSGQLAESYITHIRITEDGAYPSSPPPPDSPDANKKPRLIIIAVRSTGRVRMHKARENSNGSFSIGKTWNLEDLSAIETFSGADAPPRSERDVQMRQWAGATGFTVTITKPYYWQAGTSKEKDFFIASCVKIYRKYTKGHVPELKGFDERDRAVMLGQTPAQQPPPPQQQHQAPGMSPGMRAESRDMSRDLSTPPQPPQPPFAARPQSREEGRYRGSPGPPPGMNEPRQRSESPAQQQRRPMPPQQPSSLGPQQVPRPFASQEHMRAGSRDGRDRRPGTSPGPRPPQGRTPSPREQMMPPPSINSTRSDSPGGRSFASSASRPQEPAVSPVARPRPGYQQSFDERSIEPPSLHRVNADDQEVPVASLPNGGAASGASLFATTRQRWQAHNQQSQSPSAQQLPPIETQQRMHANTSQSNLQQRSAITDGTTSSPGLDIENPQALQALTGFWGPEPTSPAAKSPSIAQEPASPPTPERSRLRPSLNLGSKDGNDSSVDLRPAPLRSAGRSEDGSSRLGTPLAEATPRTEEPPPEIKPLAVRDKRLSTEPARHPSQTMPGAFTPATSAVPTPSRTPVAETPAETPNAEPSEEEAMAQAEKERQEAEAYRPGLGPMIKKNAVRDRFKKAATAAQAFKPRPGGAAEKIMLAKAARDAMINDGTVDGVSGFVPRPAPAPAVQKEEPVVGMPKDETPRLEVAPMTPAAEQPLDSPGILGLGVKGVELHDESPRLQPPEAEQQAQQMAEETERNLYESRGVRKAQVKVKRRSATSHRNLAALGIDPALLDNKGLDFETTLLDFGWADTALSPKALRHLETALRREQSRLEAGSWLTHSGDGVDNVRDEKAAQVEALLDKAIQECDDMEGLLTLYSVELGSLNEDIAFIEAQSQGLQVQSANQKALARELGGLVETLRLDGRVLEPLRRSDLGDEAGIGLVEGSLGRLWEAMTTMDPSLRRGGAKGRPGSAGGESGEAHLSQMKALREKKEVYEREANAFVQRFMQHLDFTFASAFGEVKKKALRPASGGAKRLNKDAFIDGRRGLWIYGPLLLFTKEVNLPAWTTTLRMYHNKASPVYTETFRENLGGWKSAARKPGTDEAELLFTAADRDDGFSTSGSTGLGAARKLTIKRSQTLAKTLRNASGGSGGGKSPIESRNPGMLMCCEAFSGAMDEMAPLISQEQNFVVELFHASSLSQQDFLEVITAFPPGSRTGADLMRPRPMDPDRAAAKQIMGVMEQVFGSFAQEMGTLLEWAVAGDPLQGVGVMASLNRHAYYLQDTSQEFLLQLLEGLTARLQNLWRKFVEEQVRAIEETKVKIKKRKGVIGFVKIFPHFAGAVENIFSAVAREDYEREAACMYETRRLVDATYRRLNTAMFDSLKVIAKEPQPGSTGMKSAAVVTTTAVEDSEDKEQLNQLILMIENMNHYVEEVDDGGKEGVLAEWKGKALMERAEALDGYVGRVVRRPLGKLLDFLDSLTSLLLSHPSNPTTIAQRPSYSRKAARSLFAQYDSKEVRRGIETLRKRIEKHFGDADEEALSRSLVDLVCKECARAYDRTIDRMEKVVEKVYPATEGEKAVEIEFSREDVKMGFRR